MNQIPKDLKPVRALAVPVSSSSRMSIGRPEFCRDAGVRLPPTEEPGRGGYSRATTYELPGREYSVTRPRRDEAPPKAASMLAS
mmetsp:Transcript_45133/g.125177  ORF Transcript_45133/g.125177 Transcript_45133/m.125177 type:complete len:84 (+) Transcript_45133:94-345(+)